MKADDPPELQRLRHMVGHPEAGEELEPEETGGQVGTQSVPSVPVGAQPEFSSGAFPKTPGGEDYVAPLSYIIEPYIPAEYGIWWNHFKIMISNILPNANIRRQDIPRYLSYFDALWLWLKVRGAPIPGEARTSFRLTMELQLTRAVNAFERTIQVTQKNVQEAPQQTPQGKKRGWWPF